VRIWLSAGEPSGDRWGANLAAALRRFDSDVELLGMPGERMIEAGVQPFDPTLRHMGVMGFIEPLRAAWSLRRSLKRTAQMFDVDPPDVVVAIDFPGYHTRLLRRAHERGIPTLYYFPPQVWAWRPERARSVVEVADTVVTGFDFEQSWFTPWAVPGQVVWEGHPISDDLPPIGDRSASVALLPGSRRSEIERLMPDMLDAVERSGLDCVIALHAPEAESWLPKQARGIPVVVGDISSTVANASAAIACSGSVTLEAACAGLPMVICYRTDPVTYAIARRLARTQWIGLPNILLGCEVYPELIQSTVDGAHIAAELHRVMDIPEIHWLDTAQRIRDTLGKSGVADRVAAHVIASVRNRQSGEHS
jgi:lipid-A-disaccharide synthase